MIRVVVRNGITYSRIMLTTCKPEEEIVAYEMDAYHAFSGQCTAIDIDSMLPNRNSQYFRLVRG